MDMPLNSTPPYYPTAGGGGANVTFKVVKGVQDVGIIYALAAVALTGLILSGFEGGRKLLSRIVWFFDRMLGGAPHTVSLPGPPGLPIVGNLLEVGHISRRYPENIV
jgi:phenylacetate 2-hydroxylase